MGKPASIQLAQLYERRTKQGRRFLSGRIGTARLHIVETDQVSKGDKIWRLSLSEIAQFIADDGSAP